MAANLRDFVLTNFEGKEVCDGLMQFSSKFLLRAAVVYLRHKLEKYCFSLLYILWYVFICFGSLLAENESYDLSELPEVVEDQLLLATKWYSNPLLFGDQCLYIYKDMSYVWMLSQIHIVLNGGEPNAWSTMQNMGPYKLCDILGKEQTTFWSLLHLVFLVYTCIQTTHTHMHAHIVKDSSDLLWNNTHTHAHTHIWKAYPDLSVTFPALRYTHKPYRINLLPVQSCYN